MVKQVTRQTNVFKDSGGGDGKTVRFVNRVSGLDEVEDDDCEEFDFL